MSAVFYLLFRESPMRVLDSQRVEKCQPLDATSFVTEADAWWAACQADLAPQYVRVIPARELKGAA